MKKTQLMILLFLSSCSSDTIIHNYKFLDDMSFDKFKIEVEKYSKNNSFPDIDS